MKIDVITIFPDFFQPTLNTSIVKIARQKGLLKVNLHNLRDYSSLRAKKVDAPAYGGGPGMLMRVEPVFSAVESITKEKYPLKNKLSKRRKIILFSPKGKVLTQEVAQSFLKYFHLILICPRYEGIDERVREYIVDEEISLGDYILSGAELAACVFIDVISRLIPGAVSSAGSIKEESFKDNLLEYPHYTRPADFRGLKVPKVLLSGNHKLIEQWRKRKQISLTQKLRPDLYAKFKKNRKNNAP